MPTKDINYTQHFGERHVFLTRDSRLVGPRTLGSSLPVFSAAYEVLYSSRRELVYLFIKM